MTMTMFVDPPELSEFAARGDPPVNAWPGRTILTPFARRRPPLSQ